MLKLTQRITFKKETGDKDNMTKRERRVTIKDVATETGYSIATVSRIVNSTNNFYGQEAQKKVEAAVKKLEYYPNLNARGLKQNKTFNIAFLVPQIDEYYSIIYASMQRQAKVSGYSVVIFSSDYDCDMETNNINHIRERRYDGVVIGTGLIDEKINGNISEYLPGLPVVIIESMKRESGISSIYIDVEAVSYEAVNHLIGLGHKRIAYVSAPCRFETLQARYNGYKRALSDSSIELDPDLTVFDKVLETAQLHDCRNLMDSILKNKDFTAMFVMSDWAAYTALHVARENGINIPEELSVISFDNMPFTEFTQPPLTTISQNSLDIGKTSIDLLFDLINGKPSGNITVTAELVLRKSTAPIPYVYAASD